MNPLNHIAIIMDGNGRWGLKNKSSRNEGHKAGLKTIDKIIKNTIEKNIRYLTLFAFSTENWKRPKKEINYLFKLLENFLKKRIKDLNNKNIRFFVIGKKNFSIRLNKQLKLAEKQTKSNNTLQLNLALNYGSKSEIINAIKLLNKKKSKISEKNISNNLYTKNIPDPDILIRTGNTQRLSNFLLWQSAYTEIFFIKKLWPDFNEKDFNKIIKKFINIKRNFGSI
jgi:undecaprenyl diphosphate synthase